MHALLDALLASAQDPTWVMNRELSLTHFNDPFTRIVEKTQAVTPCAGMSLDQLVDPHRYPREHEFWLDLLRRALSGRTLSSDTHVVIDSIQHIFAITGVPVIEENNVTAAAFTAHDITEQAGRGRDDQFELSLTRLFAETEKTLDEILTDALEYLCESDHWECAIFWFVDERENELVAHAFFAQEDLPNVAEFRARVAQMRFRRGRGLPGHAWERDDIVWVPDLLDETNIVRNQLTLHMGLHGTVAVPLHDGTRLIGVLELFTRAVRPLRAARARALLHTGAGLGRLIARRRVEDERRRLQHLLERKGLEWMLTFDAIELPIFICSLDGLVRRLNRAGRELAGRHNYSDVIGRPIGTLGVIDDEEPWITAAQCVESVRDSEQPCNAQAYHAESDRSWDIAANWYRDPDDRAPRAIIALRETTTIVRLEESVRRGEQLAALGELVAGVAHEVRNPIFGMQLTVDALEAALPQDDDVSDLLTVLRRWLERLNRLMESLLAYGKTWSLDLKKGALGDVISAAIDTVRPTADTAGVDLITRVDPDLMMLMDESRLTQAFENLILNAVQYSIEGQAVTVSAVAADGQIECTVRDEGKGFSATDLPRIFQPFFTRRRGGTGLGLSIVQRIVEEHGGTIRASNAERGGGVLTVRFPSYRPHSGSETL
jgi:signal transduction histidine kinase